MSHETHHNSDNRPTKTPFISSFWFVIILVGLFIAAVNFVNIMGHEETSHGTNNHNTSEEHHPAGDATSGQTIERETSTEAAHPTHHEGAAAGDTTHTEGH